MKKYKILEPIDYVLAVIVTLVLIEIGSNGSFSHFIIEVTFVFLALTFLCCATLGAMIFIAWINHYIYYIIVDVICVKYLGLENNFYGKNLITEAGCVGILILIGILVVFWLLIIFLSEL